MCPDLRAQGHQRRTAAIVCVLALLRFSPPLRSNAYGLKATAISQVIG